MKLSHHFRYHCRALALAASLGLALGTAAHAATLKFANQGDALSLDPYSLDETQQLSLLGNVFEPLVGRGKKLELVPVLATDWKQTAPTVWRFDLRKNVTFQDGTPFTADDVIFSLKRAQDTGSDVKTFVQQIAEIKKIDDHTIDVITKQPFPILPQMITQWYIMSQKWCEANNAVHPADKAKKVENAASFKADGTGPYEIASREPGVRTVFERNPHYWSKIEGNVDKAVFTPISNGATRVAALLSGQVDLIEPVPLQDVPRIKANPDLKMLQGPELRTIFLGMDQKRDELLYSNVKGKNPFKDKRVRQAFYQAINIDLIKRVVMRGAATPTNLLLGPGINGFSPALNKRLPYDPAASKKLLAEAGYPNGFEVGMNCPNNRYVNDAQICQAVAQMLAHVGVKVDLTVEPKATYFPRILSHNTSFYMLGWSPSSYDAQNVLNALVATPDPKVGQGQFNIGGYSNPKVDQLTHEIASESDPAKRNQLIAEALKLTSDDIAYLPLHQQALAWGVKKDVHVVQVPDDNFFLKWVSVK